MRPFPRRAAPHCGAECQAAYPSDHAAFGKLRFCDVRRLRIIVFPAHPAQGSLEGHTLVKIWAYNTHINWQRVGNAYVESD